jgi:DinB superfamily
MAAIDIQPRRTAMHGFRLKLILVAAGLAVAIPAFCLLAFVQNPAETTPPEHKRTDPQQANPPQQPKQPKQPTAAELSAKETVGSALVRNFEFEEYQFRSAAEAMPADKYDYRPTQGDYGGVYPGYGPTELRTFGEQVKHVACANFAFAAELDGKTPPPRCDTGGPSQAKTRDELVAYLHDSFKALKKSLGEITKESMFQPIEGPYAGPNTRLGLATVCVWHVADHYGQLVLYMRLNGIVPPASRPNPPELKD